ncbi:cytochrome C [Dyella solisilvae]|uniref:Cytochrome C n=1 Tax=Dyella solisilvae TaxID=1920168 RepID=A0A370KAZ3_9GAMM|nr:cytochrome c [Dyella solisilvae]RDI99832.1 cytochrome C [Dyella solisilvae]
MRNALLIVLGLVIGVMGTVFALNALHEHQPLSHTVMTMMDHHAGALRQAVKSRQCDAAQTQLHLTRLLQTQADLKEAFPGVDQPFLDEAAKLKDKTQAALQAAPADCAALATALKPIAETCQSCHQQYR